MSNPSPLKNFGTHLRALREQRGWSQEELASRSGLDRTYVGGVERGERNIGLLNISRLANALEIPIGAMFPKGKWSA